MVKNLDRWLTAYFKNEFFRKLFPPPWSTPTHIIFTCCDHYEPDWGGATPDVQLKRVEHWVNDYPKLAMRHKDADGCHPRHTFFYPAEVYSKENLTQLEKIVHAGFGEVEVHLHHDGDTEATLAAKLLKAKEDFTRHGFLSRRKLSKQIYFAFIHGNWCLNNSRSDGKWCGVNDESRILNEAGCYADFTFPSAPSETQPKKINSIYYANSRADKPKGHNTGIDTRVGKFTRAHLMMIQGPLTINWRKRHKKMIPRIENADITAHNHPTGQRADLWVKQRIGVKGKPNWIFVKVHTHGAREDNAAALLGEPMNKLFSYLETKYNDGKNFKLHYASAREMYNIIKAAEAGEKGEPGQYRNYILEKNHR